MSETFIALKDTDKQIADLLQKAQFQCLRIQKDLEYLTQLHLGSNPDSTEFYGLQIDGLEKLKTKADRLSQCLSQPAGNALSHRARLAHVFKTKPATLKLFSEIQEWYASHAPSFFLLARVVEASVPDSSHLSAEPGVITRNVNLLRKARLHTLSGIIVRKLATGSQTLTQGPRKSIKFSSASISTSSDGTQLVLDSVSAQAQRDSEDVREDVETLATILAQFDPVETNLLTCENIVELPQDLESPLLFEMSLRVPPDLQDPRSLRSLLHDDDPKEHSLNDRLDLAISLTKSVVCMHAAEFIHKNIRPENILVFKDSHAKSKLFLVGFELFRAHNGRSLGKSDDSWVKGVYRHPQRQGLYPDTDFRMQHDIYSVGVCLLELGVWECLVRYSPGGCQDRSNRYFQTSIEKSSRQVIMLTKVKR